MIQRIREGFYALRDSISDWFEARRKRRKRCADISPHQDVLHGISRQMIVIKPDNRDMFDEAIFILKDSYLINGVKDRVSLLRQAREAAVEYTASLTPPAAKRGIALPCLISFFVGGTVAALIMYFWGLLG